MSNVDAITAIKGIRLHAISPLDLVLAENLSKIDLDEISQKPPSERRVRYYSHYFSLVDAVSEKTGSDLSSLLRQKVERVLDVHFMALTYGEVAPEETILNRIERAANSIPGATNAAALGAIRVATNERIPLRRLGAMEWVDHSVLESIASSLFINVQWLETGKGAASPLIAREDEIINDIKRVDDLFMGLPILGGTLFVMEPVHEQLESCYTVYQSLMTKFDRTESFVIRPIIKTQDIDRINNLATHAASNHQQVSLVTPKPTAANQFKAGIIPIGEVLSASLIRSFGKLS